MADDPKLPAPRHAANVSIAPVTELGIAHAAPPAPEPPSDWQRYFLALSRHRWLVLAVTLAGTAIGATATQFLDSRYAARAILWMEPGGREPDRSLIGDEAAVAAAGWIELVTSNAVLDSVVRQLRLYLRPRTPADSAALETFQLAEGRQRPGRYRLTADRRGQSLTLALDDVTLARNTALGDTLGSGLGFVWAPPAAALTPGREVTFTLVAPYETARDLGAALRVRLDPVGNFLRIELRGTNPSLTTATVNAIADRVVVVAAELKRQKFEELARILGGQYAHAQRRLATAEAALADARSRNAGVLRDHTPPLSLRVEARDDPAFARAFERKLALDDVRRDRRAIEAVLAAAPERGLELEALAAIGAVRASPQLSLALDEATSKRVELRALRYKYTEESAPVQELKAAVEVLEQRSLPLLARQLASELAAREAALAPDVDSAFEHLRRVPSLALEQGRLERDVASAEELFTDVRQRYEAARLALISSLPDIRIMDPAVVPVRPAANFGPLVVVLSLVTSFGLATMGVTLRDRWDPKVRYPEQVTRTMRLPILGAVPHLRWRTARRDGGVEVIEALRGLRLRVLHAHGASGPLLLTVTSPAMGDGKSFITANLAMSFAHAGYRTLLVDGDLRRGGQHRALEAPQRPGLTDILAGDATLESALRETSHDGLAFLACGTRMERAPELLMSPSLRELMARLRAMYGVVIVDSPPLAAGVDPLVYATVTGKLLLVLRAGATDLALALSKLEVVEALPVRAIGAVLNDVRGTDAFRYYRYDASDYAEPVAAGVGDVRSRILGRGA